MGPQSWNKTVLTVSILIPFQNPGLIRYVNTLKTRKKPSKENI